MIWGIALAPVYTIMIVLQVMGLILAKSNGMRILRLYYQAIAGLFALLFVSMLVSMIRSDHLNIVPGEKLSISSQFTFAGLDGGLAVFIFFYSLILAFYLAFCASQLKRVYLAEMAKENRCRSCGYDLTGNESGVCPECGVRVGDTVHAGVKE